MGYDPYNHAECNQLQAVGMHIQVIVNKPIAGWVIVNPAINLTIFVGALAVDMTPAKPEHLASQA